MGKKAYLQILISALFFTACAQSPTVKTYTPYEAQKGESKNASDAMKTIQALYQKGEYRKALNLIDATPESSLPNHERAEYWNLRGLILLAQKKPLQSEISFQKALVQNTVSDYSSYYQFNIATALFESSRYEAALNQLDQINLKGIESDQLHKILALKDKIEAKKSEHSLSIAPIPDTSLKNSAPESSDKGNAVVNLNQPTTTYQGEVVKTRIGLLLPLSGKYENFGKKAQRAIELAFQHSTEDRAKTYELIPVDSGDSVESKLAALKQLVENQKVIAIIGPVLSSGLEALAEKAAHYQVPLISIAQANGPITTQLFSCAVSTRDQTARMVEYAMQGKGLSKFAILAPSNKSGEEMAQAFWDEVETRNGEIKGFELYDPNETDFRKAVDKTIGLFYTDVRAKELEELASKRAELNIKKKTMKTAQYFSLPPLVDFDAVFIADEAKTVGQIIPTFAYRDAKKISYLGISSWNSSQLIQRAQENAEGAVFPVAFNTLVPSPSSQKFINLYKTTYSANPTELDAISFDSALIALKALGESPSSRDEFRQKLETLDSIESATGSVKMLNHHCSRKLTLYTVQNGKLVSLDEVSSSESKSRQ